MGYIYEVLYVLGILFKLGLLLFVAQSWHVSAASTKLMICGKMPGHIQMHGQNFLAIHHMYIEPLKWALR